MTAMVPGWYGVAPGAVPPPAPPMLGPALPRYGEPGWSVWPRRIWPVDPLASAPRPLLVAGVLVGVLGTALWRPTVLSIGYLVVGVLVFGVVFGTADRRPSRGEALGIALTLGLLAVPGVLAAEWLGGLSIAAAWVVGWNTLAGGRTWTALAAGPFLPWFLPARVVAWVRRTGAELPHSRVTVTRLVRVAVVVAVTVLLLLVFGGLFASADPAFSKLLDQLVPAFDVADVLSRTVVFGVVLAFVLGGGYLVRYAPRLDAMAPKRARPLPSWEWAVPLGVLDALFVVFVVVQATVLFGGHEHVLATEGLTYAEYARQGFWQLLWVSALTLVVLAVVIHLASRASAADRLLLRVLIGTACVTSVVVVGSAIHRMWLYQQVYGYSIERLMVTTIELWLGSIFVMILLAGVRLRASWLPRAVLFAGAVALLGLAATNPERLIAERNIDRQQETGLLDTSFLLSLSPDIEPALQRLPESIRQCARYRDDDPQPWYLFNLSRSRADLGGTPADDSCSGYWTSTQ